MLGAAPDTFTRKGDAEDWLANKQSDIARGDWLDPEAGKVGLKEFGEAWIHERPRLRLRTVVLYEGL